MVTTPTLQQTITAGSRLTTDNTINGAGFDYRTDSTGFWTHNTKNGLRFNSGGNGAGVNPIATFSVQPTLNEWNVDDGTGTSALKLYPDEVELYNDEGTAGDLYLSMRDFLLEISAGHKITNRYSQVILYDDSISIRPNEGKINIDSLRTWSGISDTTYKKPMTWDTRNGRWEYAANWYGGGGGGTVSSASGTGVSLVNGSSLIKRLKAGY